MRRQLPNGPILLVEGEADQHFVIHLKRKQQSVAEWCTVSVGGWTDVVDAAGGLASTRGRSPVGMVVDADDNLAIRWQEIRAGLGDHGISIPLNPDLGGTIVTQSGGMPKIGIWVMPDNQRPGALEDFVIDLVPAGHPNWPKALNYVGSIPRRDQGFPLDKTDRAILYAWIAACKKPPFIGLAIRNNELVWQSTPCDTFIGWANRLFTP